MTCFTAGHPPPPPRLYEHVTPPDDLDPLMSSQCQGQPSTLPRPVIG